MSKYFYNNYTIDDYIVNTEGESKTADYCITNMSSSYTSKTMRDYKYHSSSDNIVSYIPVSIPYSTSSSPIGNLYSITSSSPATITAPDGYIIMAIEGTKFTSSNGSHSTGYITITPSIASDKKTATVSLGGSIQGGYGSALMTVDCTVTYSASKNYLTLPENDCRFLVSEEMQKGYHIDDFVNKLTTPYLPFFETANGAVGLELRCCDYAYNNMMQRYWAGNDDLKYHHLHISAKDLINNPNELTIAKFQYATREVDSTEVIQLASPILYIIGQAAGGAGGRGYSEHPFVGWESVYAGGAGGSGAAFIIAINIVPTFQTYSKITIERSSMDGLEVYFRTNDNDYSNYIQAKNGGQGRGADYAVDPREGGSKGTYTITDSLKNKDYIKIYGTDGTPGTSGTGGTNAPNNIYRQASGNTSRETPFYITDNYIMHNIYPYGDTGILLQEDPTGLGEPVPYMSNPNIENMLAGGPGGAPSPLFPGKSHPNNTNISNTNWPGAGGCGQSGWYKMGEPDLQDCNKGGPAAVWLFYVATDNVCDTNDYDHEYEEKSVIIQSTCTSEGKREVVCSRCRKTEIQTTPALGHTWDDGVTTKYETCTNNGIKTYTCAVCKATKTENIPTIDHAYSTSHIDPTCTEYGYTVRECIMCGKQEDIYNYEDPLGHDYRENTNDRVEPTEVKDGKATYVCYRCNDSYSEILPALGYRIINQTGCRIFAPERIRENDTVHVQFSGAIVVGHYFWVENATMTDLKVDPALKMASCNISNPTGTVYIH